MAKPDPVQVVKQRRDAALEKLITGVPYIQFLGVKFDRRGDELTAILPFSETNLPRDAYARARVVRAGRRYASVHVEGWQDNRNRMFAQATGHFLMPSKT